MEFSELLISVGPPSYNFPMIHLQLMWYICMSIPVPEQISRHSRL